MSAKEPSGDGKRETPRTDAYIARTDQDPDEFIDFADLVWFARSLERSLAAKEAECLRLREALEEIGGYDCREYDKHLSPKPCGHCLPCLARAAL